MPSGRKNDTFEKRRNGFRVLSGPQAGFLGAMLIAVAGSTASRLLLSADMVMPFVATLFLVLAAVLGTIAWRRREIDPAQISYADVAGALTLIGFFVAATIDPDQLVRLVESSRQN